MKLVKENLNDDLHITEGLRIEGVTYDNIKTPNGNVYAGEEGMLGLNHTPIPWNIVKKLVAKYAK